MQYAIEIIISKNLMTVKRPDGDESTADTVDDTDSAANSGTYDGDALSSDAYALNMGRQYIILPTSAA